MKRTTSYLLSVIAVITLMLSEARAYRGSLIISNPATSDESNMILYIILGAIAIGVLLLFLLLPELVKRFKNSRNRRK